MNKLLFPQDIVGGSFWLISVAMIGASLFFFLERGRLSKKWNTVMTLVGVIALMSSIHYFYAKNLWVMNGQAPIALRYIDWTLTFPLQILTFYVMLATVTDVKRGMFWRLLVGTLVWVIAQFLGASGYMSVTLGFLIGIAGWLYIIGELYMGEAGRRNAACGNQNVQMAFFANRLILTIGFAIYHIGYFIEHLGGGVNISSLNVIYNLGDILNKIIFGMIIYSAASQDSKKGSSV